jgi:predicted negative regulator of RcsB-dependent stress response
MDHGFFRRQNNQARRESVMEKSMHTKNSSRWPRAEAVFSLHRVMIIVFTLFFAASTGWAAETDSKNVSTMGSGTQYTTTVERQTEGKLSAEDFRQVSALGSHIIGHLNNATEYLEDSKSEEANKELDNAAKLSGIIRNMLPTTTVTTVVKDAKGNEVYRTKELVQDDLVPIYEDMVAVDVLQPIENAKKKEVTLKGVKLADAEVVNTSVLLDLKYVDRKIKRAKSLMAELKHHQALEELLLAQTIGTKFSVSEEDSPLVKAQRALTLAEKMVSEKKFEAAEANLKLAKFDLDAYKTLVGKERQGKVETMQKDIDRLFGTLEQKDSESKVRDLWSRVTNWFAHEPGKTHQTKPS